MGVEQDVLHFLSSTEAGVAVGGGGRGGGAVRAMGGGAAGGSSFLPPSVRVTVPAGDGEHQMGSLGEVSGGFFGTIKLHASGRAVLHLGDSTYELAAGVSTSFAQQAVAVDVGDAVDAPPSAPPAPTSSNSSGIGGSSSSSSNGGGGGGGGSSSGTPSSRYSYTILGPVTKRVVGRVSSAAPSRSSANLDSSTSTATSRM